MIHTPVNVLLDSMKDHEKDTARSIFAEFSKKMEECLLHTVVVIDLFEEYVKENYTPNNPFYKVWFEVVEEQRDKYNKNFKKQSELIDNLLNNN